MDSFLKSAAETLQSLSVDPKKGLSAKQAEDSRKIHGENAFTREKQISLARRIAQASCEPMVILLIMAALITLGVNVARALTGGEADYIECVGIFTAIMLSVAITVIMEGRSAKAFEALGRINDDIKVRVLRDGEVCLIGQKEIVVGDIVCVSTGDKIPADGRLIESTALFSDESSLTGESVPAEKDAHDLISDPKTPVAERTNMLYSGCFITGGNGVMAVTAVGDGTQFGEIARGLSSTEKRSTPLQEKLSKLGKTITILGAGASAAIFALQTARLVSAGTASLEAIADAFITGIILIVASVPEGLPTIVAVSLSINIIKMSKQNALVKKMVACETIGCINVICSDKTGTLTENRMTVTDIYSGGTIIKPCALQNQNLINNFCINSTADINIEEGGKTFIGNPTECALLYAAYEGGSDYKEVREELEILHSFPFSSETKKMTTVTETEGRAVAYSKGSPEKILAMSRVTEAQAADIEAQITAFQKKACRVIAFAHKEILTYENYNERREEIENDMVYDGFAAITDPLRKEVYGAVEECRSAGINLKMLTGDNLVTAKAIAEELGILTEGQRAVEARDLEELSDKELTAALPKISVIARSTPAIKMRVVKALKAMGDIVAVTGDGINDAPAIKNADVGIAMGITGTEVSKEASDIVLLNDSFATIVRAVQWGRGIYDNFQRFIQFQLTVNLSSVTVVLFSILAGFESPFTAMQLLWLNIVMDGPPALTLGLEPIRGDLMQKKPTRRDANIISRQMLSRIAVNGLFIAAVFLGQHVWNFMGASEREMSTVLFTLFVIFQLFNAFNSRELHDESIFKNIAGNKPMLAVFALTFAFQVIITQFGGMFFDTVPLTAAMWLKIVAVAFTVVLASETAKTVRRGIAHIRS